MSDTTAVSDSLSSSPLIGAETGYGVEEQPTPIRASGFFALLAGLASVFCLLGTPLLVLPVIAILLGLIALRPSDRGRPIGTLPAKIGMVLAVGFGVCGFLMPWLATQTVGTESAYFAKEYLRLMARGDREMVMEMRKDHINRVSPGTPLVTHYEQLEAEVRAMEDAQGMSPMENYKEDDCVAALEDIGGDIELFQVGSARMYTHFGEQYVETNWNNHTDPFTNDIIVTMAFKIDAETGDRQWYVKRCTWDQEQPVAESIY
ncbi:DUF4190 domain-containing protein [Crateriforma conspicua]|uniref:DUF4190 domain-containing protein n=1 Tax=Crateriforma conspicua TaxID=2527996 RepID=UPI00118A659F|nr:DUF4190 domain-containing protein [Crateriforma conspicua]QDV61444.1 hypothetical protein Mal65_05670 [Crateriforma conspicua]